MKGPQIAGLIWLANLLVAAGAAFAGYTYWTQTKDEQRETYEQAGTPQTKEDRIAWKNQADNIDLKGHEAMTGFLLTPQKRPPDVSIAPSGGTLKAPATLSGAGGSGNPKVYKWAIVGDKPQGVSLSSASGAKVTLRFGKNTPQESKVTVRAVNGDTDESAEATYTLNFTENVEPDISDEQLRRELENWVNQQFTLLRLLYGPPTIAKATVESKEAGTALIFYAGLKFKDYEGSMDNKIKNLAKHNLEVISIEKDHVLMKGPSRNAKYKDKFFEVQLMMDMSAQPKLDGNLGKSKSGGGNTRLPMPDKPVPDPNVEVVDTRPSESRQDADGNWILGTDDYKNVNVDELARYAKVVHDREGKPLGIQISDDIPEDNVVLGRGGRRGDIIKAINGQPVKSMGDVRRIVRTQYNAGTTEFNVTFERDGVPGTKVFKVPQKKNQGD